MPSKFSEIEAHLSQTKIKISFIIIVETWLSDCNCDAFELSGYKSYSLNRRLQGGGIKIYAVNDISTCKIFQITGEYNECESLFLNAHIPNYGELLVGGIYRPPQKSIPLFYEKLDSILDYIGSKRCIIGGDFNINIL